MMFNKDKVWFSATNRDKDFKNRMNDVTKYKLGQKYGIFDQWNKQRQSNYVILIFKGVLISSFGLI